MVILPAYYAASLNTDMDQVIQYYVDICEASPVSMSCRYRTICIIADEVTDSSIAIQLPFQRWRPGYVFRSYQCNYEENN